MKKIKISNIIIILLIIFFTGMFFYSLFNIGKWYLANNKNNNLKNEVNKSIKVKDDKYKVDFKKLKEENNDTVGYIGVKGTNINYVVVKSNNNDYYLNHNFNKEYNEAGWIFANYLNVLDGSDKNITLFGHGRLDGSMFGSLKKTLNKDWQENKDNQIIDFITEKDSYKYQVFSTYKIKEEDYYIKNEFKENEFNTFIKELKERSNYDYGIDINSDDKIITLSTCDIRNNYRIVLHAKLINK